METYLKLAIQKKGRLSEQTTKLLAECGIKFFNAGNGKLTSMSRNFPVELLFLRDDDIPAFVASGAADIGVVGENEVEEKDKDLAIAKRLGFAKCRLSIAGPKKLDYKSAQDLNGKKIATSYPVIVENFLKEKNIDAQVEEISGSVEIAPAIGLAEYICDLVSTGSTLVQNGLKELEVILESEALLVTNKKLSPEKQPLLDELLFRIDSVQSGKNKKYILLNAPEKALAKVSKILPGSKAPTQTPLAKAGWYSVQSVINEDDFWDIVGKLKDAGAEDILVLPIEKIVA
jgi:ATP phosphoribosyltransferase